VAATSSAAGHATGLLQEADVAVLRRHALSAPQIAKLAVLHDRLREAASEVAEDEQRAGRDAQRTGGEARGMRTRTLSRTLTGREASKCAVRRQIGRQSQT